VPTRPTVRLYKATLDVFYKPEPRILDLLYSAAEELSAYPNWETDRLYMQLRSHESRCSLSYRHNMATYDQDSGNTELEQTRISADIPLLLSALQVKVVTALRYRHCYVIPRKEDFKVLVGLLNAKLFSQDGQLRRALPGPMNDLAFRADFAEGKRRHFIVIAPVWKKQLIQLINFNRVNHLDPHQPEQDYINVIKDYPENAIYVEIVTMQEGESAFPLLETPYSDVSALAPEDVMPFVEIVRKRSDKIAQDLHDYLFSRELEPER
jgi:hypothetical protein